MTNPTLAAWSTVALRPVFAVYEGYRIDTARRLVWLAMATTAVPVPPLGIDRRMRAKPFDGIPYTRFAVGRSGRKSHMGSFQGAVLINRPGFVGCLSGQSKRLQSLRLFTNHSAVGLIFYHSLRAFFNALFLPESCLGTRTGLIRFSCQMSSPSLFGEAAEVFAVMLVSSTALVGSATRFIYVCA